MSIVAPVLRKSFLDEGAPKRVVIADLREDCCLPSSARLLKRQEVIDDYGVRNAETVELKAVHTSSVQIVLLIEEDLLHAARLLSDR